MSLLRGFACCVASVASVLSSYAQPALEWTARYHGGLEDSGRAIAVDSDGFVYVTGVSEVSFPIYEFVTIKYDRDGEEVWTENYGAQPVVGGPVAIAVDAVGNVYIAGTTTGTGTGSDYTVIKYDQDGKQLWVARYNGPASSADTLSDMAVDADGYVFVTGGSVGTGSALDYATVKYDPEGDQLWVARYNGSANSADMADALCLDSSGNVYITGSIDGSSANSATIKYNSSGGQLWVAIAEDASLHSIAVDSAGNTHVAGSAPNSGSSDFLTIKYDSSGNELWAATFDGSDNDADHAFNVALDASGNVIVSGISFRGLVETYKVYTIKYDPSGKELWVSEYLGIGHSFVAGLTIDSAGSVYMGGTTSDYWSSPNYYYVVKYAPDGDKRWEVRFAPVGMDGNGLGAMTVDSSGNIYATGTSQLKNHYDYATLKWSQSLSVAPAQYTLQRGIHVAGNLSSLFESDDDRLVIRPGLVLSSAEAPVALVVDSVLPAPASILQIVVESSASATNIRETIEAFNFATNSWDTLHTSDLVTADVSKTINLETPSNYVGPNGELRARLRARQVGPVISFPWSARYDEVTWRYIPD